MDNECGLSAPIFFQRGETTLVEADPYVRETKPGASFALSGRSESAERGHLPVRGDLAHIRLAGRYFVPHYAVPMPHAVTMAKPLRSAPGEEHEAICEVRAGETFNVLDIAGSWAWGQLGEDGFVGYLPLDALAQA